MKKYYIVITEQGQDAWAGLAGPFRSIRSANNEIRGFVRVGNAYNVEEDRLDDPTLPYLIAEQHGTVLIFRPVEMALSPWDILHHPNRE
jgi:hypothetical protein